MTFQGLNVSLSALLCELVEKKVRSNYVNIYHKYFTFSPADVQWIFSFLELILVSCVSTIAVGLNITKLLSHSKSCQVY